MALGPDSVLVLSEQMLRDLRMCNDVFALIGLCYVGKIVLSFTWTVYQGIKAHVVSKLRTPVNLRQSYGEWAVVTGCTDGIGRAYAFELARRGLNLVLISRNLTKLVQLSEIIEGQYEVKTQQLEVDFSQGSTVYPGISVCLQKLDIGILVNNVGVISPRPLYVKEMYEHSIWQHINVNVGAITMMTRIVLPKMLKKNKGAIINMSSISALGPVPLLSVYAATKAYVDYFSRALHHEVQGTGIVVQTLMPSYVNTQMVSYSSLLTTSNLMVPSPSLFAKHALPTLGLADHTTGYWLHGIQAWLISCLPASAWISVCSLLNKFYRKQAIAAHR